MGGARRRLTRDDLEAMLGEFDIVEPRGEAPGCGRPSHRIPWAPAHSSQTTSPAKNVTDIVVLGDLDHIPPQELGGIENMKGTRCPCCGEHFDVFPKVRADRSIWTQGVPLLGSVPLDPALAHNGVGGEPLVVSQPGSVQAQAFGEIAATVGRRLPSEGEPSP